MTSPAPLAPEHLRFAVLAADTVLFTLKDGALYVRLSKVNRAPEFVESKGLPGGLLEAHETAAQAATRQLKERGKIESGTFYCEQLYTFSDIERDPRGRVVAVAYLALIPWDALSAKDKVNTPEAWWEKVSQAKPLAYDHNDILQTALERLRSRVTYTTIIGKLLPKEFTLSELETAYEAITKKRLDKRNFRKKIEKLGVLTEVKGKKRTGPFRPATLYRFKRLQVTEMPIL